MNCSIGNKPLFEKQHATKKAALRAAFFYAGQQRCPQQSDYRVKLMKPLISRFSLVDSEYSTTR